MSGTAITLPTGTTGRDSITVWLEQLQRSLAALVTDVRESDAATLIDQITLTESLKATLDAVQGALIVAFARSQVTANHGRDVDPRQIQRGIADQIALACKVGPTEGSHRLHHARDLVLDMPATLTALTDGEISGWTARAVTTETAHLDPATRRAVDAALGSAGIAGLSSRAAAATARRLAYTADPQGAADRCRYARRDRRVTLRPAPDTMSLLTGLLPVEQGVACWAALDAEATRCRAAGDARGRGQIMADTLVARLTGRAEPSAIGVDIHLVVPVETLSHAGSPGGSHAGARAGSDARSDAGAESGHQAPVELQGGPLAGSAIPAPLARELLATADWTTSWWRRVFTRLTWTGGRTVSGLDARRRRFPGPIADLIDARDRTCRDPYCDAPIRHHDHVTRHSDGGLTTSGNGRGVCERGNYTREDPGWRLRILDPETHTIVTTTPTGHSYLSSPPRPPGPRPP